jgi:hypothetical protein
MILNKESIINKKGRIHINIGFEPAPRYFPSINLPKYIKAIKAIAH